jgi:hypothetical protein
MSEDGLNLDANNKTQLGIDVPEQGGNHYLANEPEQTKCGFCAGVGSNEYPVHTIDGAIDYWRSENCTQCDGTGLAPLPVYSNLPSSILEKPRFKTVVHRLETASPKAQEITNHGQHKAGDSMGRIEEIRAELNDLLSRCHKRTGEWEFEHAYGLGQEEWQRYSMLLNELHDIEREALAARVRFKRLRASIQSAPNAAYRDEEAA